MNILGISCYFHDAGAALVRDGELIAAAEKERFTRKKHDYEFPQRTIDFCLRAGRIGGLVIFAQSSAVAPFIYNSLLA
jgi:carbamoyltransferase